MAIVPEGNYRDLTGRLVAAVRQQHISREEVQRLRALASQVTSGAVTPEQATEQARSLHPALAAIWAGVGSTQLNNLLVILTLILMVYFSHEGEAQGKQQSIYTGQQAQIERTILAELQKKPPTDPAEKKPKKPKASKSKSRPKRTRAANRRAKRAEAAWKRQQQREH